jgi:hydrogenase maturation protein HypF
MERRIITLRGAVQGLGVRPAIVRLARSHQLRGNVRNDQTGVRIDAYGDFRSLTTFVSELSQSQPRMRTIAANAAVNADLVPDEFSIGESQLEGATATLIPLDRRVCDQCIKEMGDPSNRRFRYPFISCTQCGPRYSILQTMPYDRTRTSMAGYRMCDACHAEYENPDDRRCHAQTNCCFDCGPQWWALDGGSHLRFAGMDALKLIADRIGEGAILAMKGLGGYQLICDATNEQAVMRLRTAKQRPRKPLAVMVKDLDRARQLVSLCEAETQALQGASGPIVIAERSPVKESCDSLAPSIHPGLGQLGVMLPTTPLHHWLAGGLETPLVVTSGNIDGDPLVYHEHEAEERFRGIADVQLHHDRAILRPIDDSVVRCLAQRIVTLRAGRGLAPIMLPIDTIGQVDSLYLGPACAVGGHQKAAIALSNGYQAVLGPHIGDLQGDEARQRYLEQIESLDQLYSCRPERVAHDAHPDYFSTRMVDHCVSARRSHQNLTEPSSCDWSQASSIAVQHHHAHVVAGMLEHGCMDRTVLGVAMDGTGYGADGTIWGGEFLLATSSRFRRVGHLRPFRLAGGDVAIQNPARIAIALVTEVMGRESLIREYDSPLELPGIDAGHIRSILNVLELSSWSPMCSSVGRLFDGVASIVLQESRCSYEGELAMRLESVCDLTDRQEYSLPIDVTDPFQVDWRPMIRQLLDDRRSGVSAGAMAMRFHRGLASAIVTAVDRFSEVPVVLTGGVFQNRILVELIAERLELSRPLGLPGIIPVNDGGLAAGQLAIAASSHSPERPTCV